MAVASKSLLGKVIAITGAASGIGRATARECAARGALLALADKSANSLQDLANELSGKNVKSTSTCLDISSSGDVDRWVSDTIKQFGKLDGAVNGAGVIAGTTDQSKTGTDIKNIVDTTDESWNFIINVNLTGLFHCLRAQLRVMDKGASIVNVASVASLIGRPGLASYSSSKHGVLGLSRSAAKEVGPRGIRVNAVAPGPVLTPMLEKIISRGEGKSDSSALTKAYQNLPLQRLGEPEDVAKTICFLLSDDSAWTTGVVLPVDGGLSC